MNFGTLTRKAKQLVEERGGTEGLKRDADKLKDVAKGEGTLQEKAKRAADALKEPQAQDKPHAAEPQATEPQAGTTPPPARP
jgi:hypothetical protein